MPNTLMPILLCVAFVPATWANTVSILFNTTEINGLETEVKRITLLMSYSPEVPVTPQQLYLDLSSSHPDTARIDESSKHLGPFQRLPGQTILVECRLHLLRSGTARVYVVAVREYRYRPSRERRNEMGREKVTQGALDVTVLRPTSRLQQASDILLLVAAALLSLAVGLGLAHASVFANDYIKSDNIKIVTIFWFLTHVIFPILSYAFGQAFASSVGPGGQLGLLIWACSPGGGGGLAFMWSRAGRTLLTAHHATAFFSLPLATVTTPLWYLLFVTVSLSDYGLALRMTGYGAALIAGCVALQVLGSLVQHCSPRAAAVAARAIFLPGAILTFVIGVILYVVAARASFWWPTGAHLGAAITQIWIQMILGLLLCLGTRQPLPMTGALTLEAGAAHWPLAVASARWLVPAPLAHDTVQGPLVAGLVCLASHALMVLTYRLSLVLLSKVRSVHEARRKKAMEDVVSYRRISQAHLGHRLSYWRGSQYSLHSAQYSTASAGPYW